MSEYYKYPRTYHFDWSPGLQNDDRRQENYEEFKTNEIVATVKMDGENTNMYFDRIHARSIDSKDHPSRHYVKGLWGGIRHQIPEGWRICGENVYAKHSIFYKNLESYFYVFSIWDENNDCLSWDDTVYFSKELGLITVPVIYRGDYDEDFLRKLHKIEAMKDEEGYVVRVCGSFAYTDFNKNVAKFVRKNHVQTSTHWLNEVLVPNQLRNESTLENMG